MHDLAFWGLVFFSHFFLNPAKFLLISPVYRNIWLLFTSGHMFPNNFKNHEIDQLFIFFTVKHIVKFGDVDLT